MSKVYKPSNEILKHTQTSFRDYTNLYKESIEINGNEAMKKLDVSSFAKGVYFVRLSAGDRKYTEKLVIR